jgi:hypothetical protein
MPLYVFEVAPLNTKAVYEYEKAKTLGYVDCSVWGKDGADARFLISSRSLTFTSLGIGVARDLMTRYAI